MKKVEFEKKDGIFVEEIGIGKATIPFFSVTGYESINFGGSIDKEKFMNRMVYRLTPKCNRAVHVYVSCDEDKNPIVGFSYELDDK